jgi:hypothetical protein
MAPIVYTAAFRVQGFTLTFCEYACWLSRRGCGSG